MCVLVFTRSARKGHFFKGPKCSCILNPSVSFLLPGVLSSHLQAPSAVTRRSGLVQEAWATTQAGSPRTEMMAGMQSPSRGLSLRESSVGLDPWIKSLIKNHYSDEGLNPSSPLPRTLGPRKGEVFTAERPRREVLGPCPRETAHDWL